MSVIPFPSSARKTNIVPGSYETGMKVHYDGALRKVTVTFRGRVIALPGQYASQDEATWAGEAFCRENGWERESTKRPMRGRSVR